MERAIEMGLGLVIWNVLVLIEQGEHEEIDVIEEKMRHKCVIEYLDKKYKFRMHMDIYNLDKLEEYFYLRVELISGVELSKYGISKNSSGLFLLPILFAMDIESPLI